jgi:hypothetical protein
MKNLRQSFIMMAASLLLAGSAWATDAGGNSVYVDQTNADQSTVSITQTGSNNSVGDPTSLLTPQFAIDGNSMNLTITQNGMNNSITGNFIGGNSTATIDQEGNINSLILNQGNFGTASGSLILSYIGSNNTHTLNMGTTSDASNYTFALTATGNNNTITNTINSKYTNDTFVITGSHNTVTTAQLGFNGTSSTPGHYIDASIIGSNNTVNIKQDGTTLANRVTLNVTGTGTSTSITQH